ncbi:MAG TPA: tetratricopeptide repeat protein, partial [Chloroflexota bacterium]|nr:tetratricopeptide repeat protein [Chloroflexota bacterium]
AEICRRLDGLPLAIELAAARIDTLSPRRLLDQVRNPDGPARLDLLAFGANDLPDRQQTLRAAIAWSYDLLDEPDQAAFRCLSVFVGGFDVTAADQMLAPHLAGPSIDRLESLFRRSLLTRVIVGGEPRFSMLETLREFAGEQLAERDEAERSAERHARYFLGIAEAAEAKMGGPEQLLWLDRLEREHPNSLAALAWFELHASGEGLRLAVALSRFWHVRGYFLEGRQWLKVLLASEGEIKRTRAEAWIHRAILEDLRGESRGYLEEALAIFQSIGDEDGIALGMTWLARYLHLTGDVARSRELAESALPIARRAASPRSLATVLDHLAGIEVRDGNYDLARIYIAESIDLWRNLGDLLATSRTVTSQGNLARLCGDLDFAHACFAEGLAVQRAMGHRASAAWQLGLLGNLARMRGDLEAARAYLGESLQMTREFGADHLRVVPVLFFGLLSLQVGDRARGVTLVAAALRADPELTFRLDADEQADLDAQLATARAALGTDEFERAWSAGVRLFIASATELALDQR